MRALAAFLVVLALVAAETIPHARVHAAGGEECAACALAHSAPPATEPLDLAPRAARDEVAIGAPGLPPVSGAPQGAVPGQSPPVVA